MPIKKKELVLALTTAFLASLLGLILIEVYYWKTSLVCEICRFHPKLGWENIPGKTVTDGKVTYTTNSIGLGVVPLSVEIEQCLTPL